MSAKSRDAWREAHPEEYKKQHAKYTAERTRFVAYLRSQGREDLVQIAQRNIIASPSQRVEVMKFRAKFRAIEAQSKEEQQVMSITQSNNEYVFQVSLGSLIPPTTVAKATKRAEEMSAASGLTIGVFTSKRPGSNAYLRVAKRVDAASATPANFSRWEKQVLRVVRRILQNLKTTPVNRQNLTHDDVAEQLRKAKDNSSIDETKYTGAKEGQHERPASDPIKWQNTELNIGAKEYVKLLRKQKRSAAADNLVEQIEEKRDAWSKGKTTTKVGRDFDTVHFITGEKVQLEIGTAGSKQPTRAQGYNAYQDPESFILGLVNEDGSTNFYDNKGMRTNRHLVKTHRYEFVTIQPMQEYYAK